MISHMKMQIMPRVYFWDLKAGGHVTCFVENGHVINTKMHLNRTFCPCLNISDAYYTKRYKKSKTSTFGSSMPRTLPRKLLPGLGFFDSFTNSAAFESGDSPVLPPPNKSRGPEPLATSCTLPPAVSYKRRNASWACHKVEQMSFIL